MTELQNTQEIAANSASIPLKSAETALGDSHHEGENDQAKDTPAEQQQRQPRTRFSSIQRYELERAFNQCNYITPHSYKMLQKLGIPKRTIMVWFKNRRVKLRKKMLSKPCSSREHLKQAASSTPVISAHQSSILQAANCEVQNTRMEGPSLASSREHWPYVPTGRIIDESLGCTGMTLSEATNCAYNDNTWSHWETSSTHKYPSHPPSPASIQNTAAAMSYASSGISQTQRRASLPLIHRDSQRAGPSLEGPSKALESSRENWPYSSTRGINDESLGCTGVSLSKAAKGVYSGNTWSHCEASIMHKYISHPPLPHSINTAALSYGSSGMNQNQLSPHPNVPWLDNARGLAASLSLIRQGDQRVPEHHQDPGHQLWDHRDRTHSSTLGKVPQVDETSHSNVLMCPNQHDLEYSSLLDDLLDVLQSDLATQNNTAAPPFLANTPNSSVSL